MIEKLEKTVHITNYYHRNSGGISTSYNALMAAAERHQRKMALIVPGEKDETEIVNDFAKIHYVAAKYSPVFDKRYRIIMPWQYLPGGSSIRKILLEERPQMVEVTDKYTLSMLGAMIRTNKFKQLGRPMLVHFSCERMDDNIASFLSGGSIGKWVSRRLMGNYNFPSFDFHIANSTYTAEEFYASVAAKENPRRSKWFINKTWRWLKAPRVPVRDRIYVCPRGVDIRQFRPDRRSAAIRKELAERAGVPVDALLLLYAGRISPEKNIPLLIEMMKLLAARTDHDVRLIVAGAGPLAETLEAEGQQLGEKKIVQLGHLDKESLANYYANVDVFVHPNPREPFGIAPLEAMASGVATVAPNAGGILSYATDDNIWLTEPNADAFAAAVLDAASNIEARELRIAAALETARSNTREASTDNLFATYDKLYDYFQRNLELFTDREAASRFSFTELLDA
ncbi:MAG: glycosyltransferase [Acidobacteria bacterium]|nr:glycosyltransferase [Acidobacteriota bacterium]